MTPVATRGDERLGGTGAILGQQEHARPAGREAEGNDLLLDEIRSVALAGFHPLTAHSTRIVSSRISEHSGIYDAAHLALREVLDPTYVDLVIKRGTRLRVEQAG